MRYLRIFSIYFQDAFVQKSRSFVWFLLSLTGPFMFLLFWTGAKVTKNAGFNLSAISSYYFLLTIASSLLMAHIENEVGIIDIHEGGLVNYLLKPFSYFWLKFFLEIPWRILQSIMGGIVFLLLILFFISVKTIHLLSLKKGYQLPFY